MPSSSREQPGARFECGAKKRKTIAVDDENNVVEEEIMIKKRKVVTEQKRGALKLEAMPGSHLRAQNCNAWISDFYLRSEAALLAGWPGREVARTGRYDLLPPFQIINCSTSINEEYVRCPMVDDEEDESEDDIARAKMLARLHGNKSGDNDRECVNKHFETRAIS